jgi:2-oxoglutarate dehydrogenase E1 component
VLAPRRRPLVVLTPKRYLRMPATVSPVSELTDGAWRPTIVDDGGADAAAITRIVACSGKIGHELIARRVELGAPAAVVRVEQLYPVAEADFVEIMQKYASAREIVWVQEEPENMGAWRHLRARFGPMLFGRFPLSGVSRAESASPATGSASCHKLEQQELLERAFAG